MSDKINIEQFEELLFRVVNRSNALEKHPMSFGTKHKLYHSERHLLDKIGENPRMNVTEFAAKMGVTKGAISQVISKLEKKDLVTRYKHAGNNKETLISLTDTGKTVFKKRKKLNREVRNHMIAELNKYSRNNVESFMNILKWLDVYLEKSNYRMAEISKQGI